MFLLVFCFAPADCLFILAFHDQVTGKEKRNIPPPFLTLNYVLLKYSCWKPVASFDPFSLFPPCIHPFIAWWHVENIVFLLIASYDTNKYVRNRGFFKNYFLKNSVKFPLILSQKQCQFCSNPSEIFFDLAYDQWG